MKRRDLLRLAAGAGATAVASRLARPRSSKAAESGAAGTHRVVSSGNGERAVRKASELIGSGADPLEAVIAGVNILEDDPDEMSVGYGGVPNEEGVVELDASVMDGRTMKSGAVGALHNVRHASRVAESPSVLSLSVTPSATPSSPSS